MSSRRARFFRAVRRTVTALFVLVSTVPTEAQIASVSGVVRDARTQLPVANATVNLPDVGRSVSTDAAGRYLFTNVPAGPQHLVIHRLGYAGRTVHALVPGTGTFRVDASLEPLPLSLRQIEVLGPERVTPSVNGGTGAERASRFSFDRSSTRSDEPDALQAIAGGVVSAEPELSVGLSIRGGAPDHTGYLVDDIPVFNPYHSAGVFGAWNPAMLASVGVVSSSYELPDALGGHVAAETRMPRSRFHASISASTTQTSAALDGPLFGMLGYLVSFRRTFAGSALRPSEPSYLDGHGDDWLARLVTPLYGGSLSLLGIGNANHFDAASAPTETQGGSIARNEFEWYSRSLGARWEKAIGRIGLRGVVWHASGDASSRWRRDPLTQNDLAATHSSTGAFVGVQTGGAERGGSLGVRWTRLEARYRVDGRDRFLRDNEVHLATLFGGRRAVVGPFHTNASMSLTHAAGTLRASPRLRLDYPVSQALRVGASAERSYQYAQSLRNTESVVGVIFPADLFVAAGGDVPVARSDQIVIDATYQPLPEARFSGEIYGRRLNALVLPFHAREPFIDDSIVTATGRARGIALHVVVNVRRSSVRASYAWQDVRYSNGMGVYSPPFVAAHQLDAGAIFFITPTWSVRAGVTGATGQHARPVAGEIEWESCNLLDGGCEFAGSPDALLEPSAGDGLPAYWRTDIGVRKHWHVRISGADSQLAVFGTLTNVFSRRNVLRVVMDSATNTRSYLGLRPFAPLTVGFEWRL